jgi:riboflavin kinase/FMN adenylyltransferase
MIICRKLEELDSSCPPLHLALGVFDGVHIGHQEVISRALAAAKREGGMGGVLTFDPHPIRVIAPTKAPAALLATLGHKEQIIRNLGADLFIALHFDTAFAAMEPGEFLDRLFRLPVKTIAVGEDWRFGRGRHGDVEYLRAQAEIRGFTLEAIAPVMVDGERVSSTRIRQAIRDGNFDAAARLLGRPYSVCGPVIHGRKLGRTIGFPTANVYTADSQLPQDGVWAITATLPGGITKNGVANLGVRPTVDGSARTLEVHLFDFQEDIYGKELEVEFRHFIRPEEKFSGVEELRRQIGKDVEAAKQHLA